VRRLALAAAGLLACGPTVLVSEPPEGAPDAAACDDGPECDACLADASEDTCGAAVATCDGMAACGAFDACYDGEPMTAPACAEQHPAGAVAWRALVGCVCGECAETCCRTCSSPWGLR